MSASSSRVARRQARAAISGSKTARSSNRSRSCPLTRSSAEKPKSLISSTRWETKVPRPRVRATHNEFMARLLPVISQAVETAIVSGQHGDRLAEHTLRDHALLMEFFEKRDPEGARHAMAVHMRHAMDEMELGPSSPSHRWMSNNFSK